MKLIYKITTILAIQTIIHGMEKPKPQGLTSPSLVIRYLEIIKSDEQPSYLHRLPEALRLLVIENIAMHDNPRKYLCDKRGILLKSYELAKETNSDVHEIQKGIDTINIQLKEMDHQYQIIKELIRTGNNTELLLKTINPIMRNEIGESLLHHAAFNNNILAMELLLDKGADINATTNTYGGYTPLYYAITSETNNLQAVELLIQCGANVHARYAPETILHIATKQNNTQIMRVLIRYGADIEATIAATGETPLILAADRRNYEAAFLLLKAGANIYARDSSGNTPLHRAMRQTHLEASEPKFSHNSKKKLETAKLLLGHLRTGINQQNNKGQTPLDTAIFYDNTEAVAMLLARRANVTLATLTKNQFDSPETKQLLINVLAMRTKTST